MTVTLPNHHLLTDSEVEAIRVLVDATALLLIDDLHDDQRDIALHNLSKIERYLHAIARDTTRPIADLCTVHYGRVSVARIGSTREGRL
jgi:hypothetical protein